MLSKASRWLGFGGCMDLISGELVRVSQWTPYIPLAWEDHLPKSVSAAHSRGPSDCKRTDCALVMQAQGEEGNRTKHPHETHIPTAGWAGERSLQAPPHCPGCFPLRQWTHVPSIAKAFLNMESGLVLPPSSSPLSKSLSYPLST